MGRGSSVSGSPTDMALPDGDEVEVIRQLVDYSGVKSGAVSALNAPIHCGWRPTDGVPMPCSRNCGAYRNFAVPLRSWHKGMKDQAQR